jgi:hypothetical protein
MKKIMLADLVKEIYPDTIEFAMTASYGLYEGTFGRTTDKDTKVWGPADIKATRIENNIYRVIATFLIYGTYEYIMPYDVLIDWKRSSSSGKYYNTNIKGQAKYFPKSI